MTRLKLAFSRYGWRTLIVGLILVVRRTRLRSRMVLLWWSLFTKGVKGKRIHLGVGCQVSPGGFLQIGSDVYVGSHCVFEISVNPPGKVIVGDRVWISRDCHFASNGLVRIEDGVLIGEFVSIRDTTHSFEDLNTPILGQVDRVGSVIIERNAWIGRGCLIQAVPEDLLIGEGAIVAANSVVRCSIPEREIWGGTPARYIRHR